MVHAHGLSSAARLALFTIELDCMEPGIVLIQETWRKASGESMQIGDWRVHFSGNENTPRGSGTGIAIHKSMQVKSWKHVSGIITSIRMQYVKTNDGHVDLQPLR